MKNTIFLAIALIGNLVYGTHTVCSSPSFYYSSVRRDFGTQPPPGTELGKRTIFSQGKLLVNETFVQGGGFSKPKYEVSLVGPKVELSKEGSATVGTVIYTDTAVLKSLAPDVELQRTPVVCQHFWALVP